MSKSDTSGLGVGLGAELSFDDLHNKFRAIVDRELTVNSARITPRCEPYFNRFIDSGVSYLLNSHASSRQVTAAERRLRGFTLQAINVANSRGKTILDIQTFRIVRTGGMWCPPFCGEDDE